MAYVSHFKQHRTWRRRPAADHARVLAIDMPCERIERARRMPDAGRTHGPPAEKTQAAVTTGSAETTGIPRATVLTLIRDLPGDRLDCPRHLHNARSFATGLASAPGRQDHTTSRPHPPRSSARVFTLAEAVTSIASRLTCRDDRAQRPSGRGGTCVVMHNFGKNER
jgi:hypothetical protein